MIVGSEGGSDDEDVHADEENFGVIRQGGETDTEGEEDEAAEEEAEAAEEAEDRPDAADEEEEDAAPSAHYKSHPSQHASSSADE